MNNILIVTLGNGGYLHMSKLLGTYRKVKVHIYRLYPMKGGDVNRRGYRNMGMGVSSR